MLKLLFVFYLFLLSVQTERCPTVQTMSPFDAEQYMGKWYELERYPAIFEMFQKCVSAQYSINSDGTVNVTNTGYTIIGEYPLSVNGRAEAELQNPSNLTVYFDTFGSSHGGHYYVLDTDYSSYSLVYSCFDVPFLDIKYEYAWILGRNKNISSLNPSIIENLKQILTSIGSSPDKFSETTQDCDN